MSDLRRFSSAGANVVALLGCAAPAAAQIPERPPLGSSITIEALGILPAPASLFSLLDTAVPDVIAENPADHDTSFVGADLTIQIRRSRWTLLSGITAGRSDGWSANRGFGALENDAAVLGEVFLNPNAKTNGGAACSRSAATRSRWPTWCS